MCQGVHVSRRNHHQRAQQQKNIQMLVKRMHGSVCFVCAHVFILAKLQSVCGRGGGSRHRPSGSSPCTNGCSPGVDPGKAFPALRCW